MSGKGYLISGGIPWPKLGDGTMWADSLQRVRHAELPGETGTLRSVEWAHPDGAYMPGEARMTKTKTPRPKPGAWWAVVSWDSPDRVDRPLARTRLDKLVPEDGAGG